MIGCFDIMRRRTVHLRALPVALALAATASVAHAQTEAAPLTYSAVAGCPTKESFEASVRARTPLARFGESARALRRFAIEASAAHGRFTATLKVVSPNGSVADREVDGETCEEVIDALALVTALAIDPKASTLSLAAPSATPSTAAPPVPVPPPRAPPSRRAESRSARWEPSLGVAASGANGITPTVLLGVAVHGAIANDVSGWWAPSIRLTLEARKTFEGSGANAGFALVTAGLDLCPSAVQGGGLSFRPCVGTSAGLLHARGISVSTPASADSLWLDVRGLGRVRWLLAGGRGFVEFEGGALLPVTRPTFVFQTPRIVLHEVTSVAFHASIGVGVCFP